MSEEETGIYPESDADRPAEPAGANGDGEPVTDSKVASPADAQSNHRTVENSEQNSAELGENDAQPQQDMQPNTEEGDRNMNHQDGQANAAAQNPEVGDMQSHDSGQNETEAQQQQEDASPDVSGQNVHTSEQKRDSEGEDGANFNVNARTQSEASGKDLANGTPVDVHGDGLNNSDSTLESVSFDGSYHSEDSQILPGQTKSQGGVSLSASGTVAMSFVSSEQPANAGDTGEIDQADVHVQVDPVNLNRKHDSLHGREDKDGDGGEVSPKHQPEKVPSIDQSLTSNRQEAVGHGEEQSQHAQPSGASRHDTNQHHAKKMHGAHGHPPQHHSHVCSNVLEAKHHPHADGAGRVYMYVPDRDETPHPHDNASDTGLQVTESAQSLYSFPDSLEDQHVLKQAPLPQEEQDMKNGNNDLDGQDYRMNQANSQNPLVGFGQITDSGQENMRPENVQAAQSDSQSDNLNRDQALERMEAVAGQQVMNNTNGELNSGMPEDPDCFDVVEQGYRIYQMYPDYPVNINNYKVCRLLEPGVKECVILETGEHIKCARPQPAGHVTDNDGGGAGRDSPGGGDGGSPPSVVFTSPVLPPSDQPVPKTGFKVIQKQDKVGDNLLKFGNLDNSCPHTGKLNRSENASENSHFDRHRSVSECSSTRDVIVDRSVSDSSSIKDRSFRHDLNDFENGEDVYVYETETDLRSFARDQLDFNHGTESATRTSVLYDQRDKSSSSNTRDASSLTKQSPTQRFPAAGATQTQPKVNPTERIDMSPLYRAERWLDDRNVKQPSRRQNNSSLSTSVSISGSGAIPGFRTLQEQQASWMKMFKLLEDQHQTDLVSQYEQHQRNIHSLQEQIELDLVRQQESFQERLTAHREMLLHNASLAGSYLPSDYTPDGAVDDGQTVNTGTVSSLPRPFLPDDDEEGDNPVHASLIADDSDGTDDLPTARRVRRSLDNSYGSDRGLNSSTKSSSRQATPTHRRVQNNNIADDPVASPYLSQSRQSSLHKRFPTSLSQPDLQSDSLRKLSPRALANVSSNANVDLREKHTKHLADLRAYYERELVELRTALTSPEFVASQSPYKQVMEENIELQGQLEAQEDNINAARRTNRELENKVQTLQIRLDDTLEMYEESQSAIGTLRHHGDELRVLCKEGEARIEDLEGENRRLTAALNEAYKVNEQHALETRKTEAAMKRLTERQENLNQENESNKEALNQMDGKLYDSRMEIVQLKRLISKLELESNRLSRENNNLRHKGLVSSLGLSNFYAASPAESVSTQTPISTTPTMRSFRVASPDLSDIHPLDDQDSDHSEEVDLTKSPPRGDSYSPSQSYRSPLVKAEEDLRELRRSVKENLSYSLSQQRAIPRTSSSPAKMNRMATRNGISSGKSLSSESSRSKSAKKSSPPTRNSSEIYTRNGIPIHEPVTIIDSLSSRQTPQHNNFTTDIAQHLPSGGTPTRFDIDVGPPLSRNGPKKRSPKNKKDKTDADKVGLLTREVQATLNKVRAGEFVTRPGWENRDTTTVKPTKSVQPRPKVKEEKVQERVRTIHDLEVKYDELQFQKRELESALSRVPLSGKLHHQYHKEKEDLDNRLDKVDRELGSVRMSLKRYHVLKTSGH